MIVHDKTEINIWLDKKWYMVEGEGIFKFAHKGRTKEEAARKAKLHGLKNYTIVSFWESEYL